MTRIEHDALGDVELADDALYGANTARAIANFRVSGVTLASQPLLLRALARVKRASARANAASGVLDPGLADAIAEAAGELANGEHVDAFPIDLVQGGGGTATNMNVNEVLARRANAIIAGLRGGSDGPVHPNDHVNRNQSTNDVYPTALQLALLDAFDPLLVSIARVVAVLERLAGRYEGQERLARTCLQDALPIGIDDAHRGQALAFARAARVLEQALAPLLDVPLGGGAVGTGLGAPEGYRTRVVELLAEECGRPLRGADSPFDALAHLDGYVGLSSALVRVMLTAEQLARDLRLLASGPRGGIGELRLPTVAVGSSAMPGKINPAIPELVMQVSFEVRGRAQTVELAVAAGELELNVMEPVIARALLEGAHDAALVLDRFAERCLDGLEWQLDVVAAHLQGSLAGAVELAAREGYVAASDQASSGDPS
jgi:aspartate ammonia-lyase